MTRLKFYISVLFAFALLRVICGPLNAAIYYVASASSSPAGSNSNAGSQGAPWLTLQYAVNHMACGDTLMVVADGNTVTDGGSGVNPPPFANCSQVTTIQSSKLANFAPIGTRTNPAIDNLNYGKVAFGNSGGISARPAVYTFNPYFSYSGLSFNTSTNTVTLTGINGINYGGLSTFGNGSQLELEVDSTATYIPTGSYPSIAPPGGLSFLTRYYAVNCSGCGAQNTSFQLAATPGGSPISITSCGAWCSATVSSPPSGSCPNALYMQYSTSNNTSYICSTGLTWGAALDNIIPIVTGLGLQVNPSPSNTFSVPQNWGSGTLANGNAVAVSAVGLQLFGTLPAPLQLDKIYYVVNLSGSTFQLALTPGGSPITITSVGTGIINFATTAIASNWAFRGLELMPNGTSVPNTLLEFGNGSETSIYGMTSHMEVDRCYLHDNPPTQGINHDIVDDGLFLYLHDSWVIGATFGTSDAQALYGGMSLYTTVINNFMEAATEVVLNGGSGSAYGQANAYKLFQSNYFYKPPVWKKATGFVPISGPCLYDATDPLHAGGEWWKNTSSGQVYQCASNGQWATTASTFPAQTYTIKDMTEHKNGRYFSYIGNLYNYSIAQDQSGQLFNNSLELGPGGAPPGGANDHITIMNNAGYNSMVFMSRTSQCNLTSNAACPVIPGSHTTVNNLLVTNTLASGVTFSTTATQSGSNTIVVADASGIALTSGNGLTICVTGIGIPPNTCLSGLAGTTVTLNQNVSLSGTVNVSFVTGTGFESGNQSYVGGVAPNFTGDYWNHNTIWTQDLYPFGIGGWTPMFSPVTPCPNVPLSADRVTEMNSILPSDFQGACGPAGTDLLNSYSNSSFLNNALRGSTGSYSSVGASNTFSNNAFPAGNATIGYVSATGLNPLNYALSASSNYSAANGSHTVIATDGTDLGADMQVIAMAQWCAQNGKPCPSVNIAPGSVNALLTFQAPALGTCTALLYPGTGPRNSTTLISTTTDTISSGISKEIDLTSLTASTGYQFTVTCAGDATWIYVGRIQTLAVGSTSKVWSTSNASGLTWYKSSSPSMSSPTSIGSGATIQASVSAGGLLYVSPLCTNGSYCGVVGTNAP